MKKVNEFERGYGFLETEDANHIYRLPAVPQNWQVFLDLVKDHQMNQVPRLKRLHRYYLGKNDGVISRSEPKGDNRADYRTPHSFAEYITMFRTSYILGKPVKTDYLEDGQDEQQEWLEAWNTNQDIDAHNFDLGLDLSKFGRAYELLYRGFDDVTHIATSHPYWSFVVYDETVSQKPLFAVRYPSVRRGDEELYQIEVYLEDRTLVFPPTTLYGARLGEPVVKRHYFGEVPVIEYQANRDRMGDYERAIPLMDLYDYAQADTGNYLTNTNEAMLVITGDFNPDDVTYDKHANMLLLPTGTDAQGKQTSLQAEYINPVYDVQGTEAYKSRLRQDIFLFSYTPDVSDENFAGNRSGEAMKYKLIGLEQDCVVKERLLRQGLIRRYQLLANISHTVRELQGEFKPQYLKVTFTPNLPVNLSQELSSLVSAGAKFSQATLLSQASFVDNVQTELDQLAKEREANAYGMQQFMRGSDSEDQDDGVLA